MQQHLVGFADPLCPFVTVCIGLSKGEETGDGTCCVVQFLMMMCADSVNADLSGLADEEVVPFHMKNLSPFLQLF